jgi:pectin methylesterase-like acyl-CoA thioesterase
MKLQDATLISFMEQSKQIMTDGLKLAQALPANTVQVWPGGATFSTIQAAINSVSNASPQLQYQVAVGSGTYNENVVMKDYVYIIGAGQGATIITALPQQSNVVGVVNSASGCGISDVMIDATGGNWGTWPTGIKICGSGKFHISGVTINSGDISMTGDNVRGITNNTGSYSGTVILGSSILNIVGGPSSSTIGLELFGFGLSNPLTVFIDVSSIVVSSQSQSFGVITASGASVILEDSKVSAATWTLYNSDNSSPITANQCTINGPVSGGVVVNNG